MPAICITILGVRSVQCSTALSLYQQQSLKFSDTLFVDETNDVNGMPEDQSLLSRSTVDNERVTRSYNFNVTNAYLGLLEILFTV